MAGGEAGCGGPNVASTERHQGKHGVATDELGVVAGLLCDRDGRFALRQGVIPAAGQVVHTPDAEVALGEQTRISAALGSLAGTGEVGDGFVELGVDGITTALVLTGEGRSFSAGLDLRAVVDLPSAEQDRLIEALNRAFLAVYSCPRLVVAAVNGHAIAGGLVLALCCDVRLVADAPLKAGLAEVRVGVVYPVGAIEVVRHELAPHVARRLVLTGANVEPVEAVALGVFDRLIDPRELLETAVAAAGLPTPGRFRQDQGTATGTGAGPDARCAPRS